MEIKYLGHSAFEIEAVNEKILIDPFLVSVPNYKPEGIIDIFVTHGHGDHLGSAIEISKTTGAPITTVFELANYCKAQGVKVKPVGLGSWINYSWGRAVFLPAFHSSSLPDGSYGGNAASILFDIDGVRIYHAGDTCLSSEMKTIKELYAPQIALLPIGGNYTMDVEHAAMAAKWLGVRTVIPMHYNTYPEIQADLQRFANLIAYGNTACQILNPAEIK